MNINYNKGSPIAAIVIFTDKTSLWFLKGLARGFRHCFMMIEQSNGWVLYDPLSNRSVITYFENLTREDILEWYDRVNFCIQEVEISNDMPTRIAPPLPYTCVEGIKRLLGIHRWLILTPRQLFNYLTEQNMNKKLKEN